MRTDDFQYDLPEGLIAQTPLPRGASRLLVLHRDDGSLEHRTFGDLRGCLRRGDVLVVNDSRVTARRLTARQENGRPAEVLLLQPHGPDAWKALVRPGRRLRIGAGLWLDLPDGSQAQARVVETTPEGGRIVRLADPAHRDLLAHAGTTPVPPYIHVALEDEERYQTVYAGPGGSAAAPTAGLHFTAEMLDTLEADGVAVVRLTLHVGVDTFRPVRVDDVEHHVMHGEWFSVSAAAATAINAARGRVVAAGTTAVRALESAADADGHVRPATAETRLFITPGYRFRVVDAMLTNFHLPRSTLLMLVAAFAGRERVMAAYAEAVARQYRFYSFGDAMLIV